MKGTKKIFKILMIFFYFFRLDSQSFIGETDLWCTTNQFWEIGAGDEEEHATLLYNYLYYLSSKNPRLDKKVIRNSLPSKSQFYPSEDEIKNESIFLVICKAIPEGNSVYVLLRDAHRQSSNICGPENFLVINPCTGFIYSAVDPNCPLKEIYCLVTPYNIWANIQVFNCKLKVIIIIIYLD
jgi:coiled-coil and C2 domain-containing protein 2A